MADKWDEITQLEEAYKALAIQPREAQLRMLRWLTDRLQTDHDAAMMARQKQITTSSVRDGAP